jgi:hypothetical protein
MRASLKLTAIAAVALAAPASAELGPSPSSAIAGAVSDCWSVAGTSIDEARLQQLGWKAGTMSSPDGKPVATPLRFYGKAGSNVMLMLMNQPGMTGCTVLSRVTRLEDVNSAAGAIQKSLLALNPEIKTTRSGQSIVFIALPRIAMLDATGTKAKPNVRVVVSYRNPEKK